jgi:hypothetical protein
MAFYDNHFGTQFGWLHLGDASQNHSMRDFGLYPKSKPVVSPPVPKTMVISIPGANGNLDFSESLTGYTTYENRQIKFEYSYLGDRAQFDRIYHTVLNAIHGRTMGIILDEDSGYYYHGRITVDEPEYDKKRMYLTITADVFPYQMELYASDEPWVWDTFSFVDGVIRDYSSISVNSVDPPLEVTVFGSPMPTVPHIYKRSGTGFVTYTVDGVEKTVNLFGSGDMIAYTPDLVLHDGENLLKFSGTMEISISFRGGRL